MASAEKKKYRKNYLVQVICQLTFDKNDAISEETLKTYKNSLGEGYAELSTIRQQGIIIEGNGSELKSHTEDNHLWQIESIDKSHQITITNQSFAITYSKYVIFRDYIEVVNAAQSAFFAQFSGIVQLNRTGLRYINQVAPPSLEQGWGQYITDKLTASLGFVEPGKLRRSMQTMSIQHDEDIKINFNFGIFNEFFPAPVIKNEFILDFDAFTDSAHSFEDCRGLIEKFNTAIAIYFEDSITNDLRSEMGVIDDRQQ